MPERGQVRRPGARVPGPRRPRWPFLVAGGLIYAGALLGVWIVLAGEPDVSDLIAGSAAAVFSVGIGYLLSERGTMAPGLRAADVRALAVVPWQLAAESWQVFALAARKAAGRPTAPGALRTVPVQVDGVLRGWPAARREAALTALLSAAPNTVVVDIDMEAGTALVHQLVER
jgi:multisubunit Na+/H+ antiporter MnhE subunit